MTDRQIEILWWLALLGVCLVLAGCMSAEGQQEAISALSKLRDQGTISQSQFEAGVQAVRGQGFGALGDILADIGEAGLAVVLSLLGVRVWRGGIKTRKGEPPEPSRKRPTGPVYP